MTRVVLSDRVTRRPLPRGYRRGISLQHVTSTHAVRRQGVTLIEALICLVVMSLGILALMGLQTNLRYSADLARQYAEASRIASRKLEYDRTFATTAEGAASSWQEMISPETIISNPASELQNATYTLKQVVTEPSDGTPRKVVQVIVKWADRRAVSPADTSTPTTNQEIRLLALIAGIDPQLSGQLAVPQITPPSSLSNGRNPAIPLSAQDIGGGRSAFKPFDQGTSVWVFSNSTGEISSICDGISTHQGDITASTLESAQCRTVNGLLVSGFVSGLNDENITLTSAATPTGQRRYWPLNDTGPLEITNPVNVTPTCVSDSKLTANERSNWELTSTRYKQVTYYCAMLLSDAASGWGGTLKLVPENSSTDANTPNPSNWAVGNETGNYKVCRYTKYVDTTTDTHKDFVSNVFHPKTYCMITPTTSSTCPNSRVKASIKEQNFLIIPSTSACPEYDSSTSAAGSISYNTRPHQP